LTRNKLYHPHYRLLSSAWKKLANAFGIPQPLDRSGITDFGFEYKILNTIPTDPYTTLSFDQICDIRAAQIYKSAVKPIMIMYSGGIDSTVVISAFIKLDIEFIVGYTDSTIKEYPWIITQLRNNAWPKVTLVYIANKKITDLQKSYHIVTGVVGDQIAGSVKSFAGNSGHTNEIRARQLDNYEDVLSPYLLDTFSEQIDAFPIKLNDFSDFLWWISFTFKYQWVCLGFINSVGFDSTQLSTYTHFFNDIDFQKWSMSNRDLNKEFIVRNAPLEYKANFKKYSYDVLGDRDYLENKRKVSSISSSTFGKVSNYETMIDEINNQMHITSYLEYIGDN